MSLVFEVYKLNDVLTPYQIKTFVNDKEWYRQVTITNDGTVRLRGEKLGKNIGRKRQFLINLEQHPNTLVFIRQTIRDGGIGLASDEVNGCVVTENFPMFDINTSLASPKYLHYYFRSHLFKQELNKIVAKGTAQKAIHEDDFINLTVLLPAIPFQEAVVKRLDQFVSKIEILKSLYSDQEKDFRKLVYSNYLSLLNESEWIPFSEVSPVVRRPIEPDANKDYIEIGIRSFGNGTFHKAPVKGKQIAHKSLFKIKAGDLVFSNVFSWEGAIALAKEQDDVCIGSHRFITTVPNKERINPDFLLYHLLSPKGLEDINKASPGTAGRNKTLGVSKLEKILVPVPQKEQQDEFAELLRKVNDIKKERSKNEQKLKALFPSILDKAFKGEW